MLSTVRNVVTTVAEKVGGTSSRSEAGKKAAATRKREARKRSEAAKKGAQTRKAASLKRTKNAKSAAKAGVAKRSRAKSRSEAMLDAMRGR